MTPTQLSLLDMAGVVARNATAASEDGARTTGVADLQGLALTASRSGSACSTQATGPQDCRWCALPGTVLVVLDGYGLDHACPKCAVSHKPWRVAQAGELVAL